MADSFAVFTCRLSGNSANLKLLQTYWLVQVYTWIYLPCTPYIIVLKWVLKPVLGFEKGEIIGGRRKLSLEKRFKAYIFHRILLG